MNSFSEKLLNQLEDQLHFISVETDDTLKKAELSVNVCNEALNKLKRFSLKYKFQGEADEIRFFKQIKPGFYSKLIYHVNVYNIETHRPNGSEEAKRKYLHRELKVLETFFNKNLDFIKYYRTRKTYLDHKYFVRGKHDLSLTLDSFFFDTDSKFSTSHDYKVSRIKANELLEIFLTAELAQLDAKQDSTQQQPKAKLNWTGSKASLVELIYALQSTGAFNNSNATVKEIAGYFGSIFNIDLSNFYKSYQEIRERKSNQTIFLTTLQEALQKRIEEKEERFINN